MPLSSERNNSYLQPLRALHRTLVFGQAAFGVALFFIRYKTPEQPVSGFQNTFMLITPAALLLLVMWMAANGFFNNQLIKARAQPELGARLDAYRMALIIRYAMLEGVYFISIIFFYITGIVSLLFIAGLLFISFLYFRPTAKNIQTALHLSEEETQQI